MLTLSEVTAVKGEAGNFEVSILQHPRYVDTNKCIACGVCIEVCPYQAIDLNDQGKALVNEVLCKGCGICAASCRSGAPQLSGFTDAEIFAQIANV